MRCSCALLPWARSFRWVCLSGDPADLKATDEAVLRLLPDDALLRTWMEMAGAHVPIQGLPARTCWLALGERDRVGLMFNAMVKSGELKGPIAMSRDHLDAGSVAQPSRETEGMLDGSDAVADWPLLNALLNTANGADLVTIHQGAGSGMGGSISAGMTVIADGSESAAQRISRALFVDPPSASFVTPTPDTTSRSRREKRPGSPIRCAESGSCARRSCGQPGQDAQSDRTFGAFLKSRRVGIMRKFAAAGLAVLLALSSSAPVFAQGAPKNITVLANYTFHGRHSPFFVALDKGFFDQAGFKVDIQPATGSGFVISAIESGKADYGLADASTTVQAIAKGSKVKGFQVYMDISTNGLAAMTPLPTPESALGKSIALRRRIRRVIYPIILKEGSRSGEDQLDRGHARHLFHAALERAGGHHRGHGRRRHAAADGNRREAEQEGLFLELRLLGL